MQLQDRILVYKNVEKGPLRTLLKMKENEKVYYYPNGVGICDKNVDIADIGTLIEQNDKYKIFKLRNYI